MKITIYGLENSARFLAALMDAGYTEGDVVNNGTTVTITIYKKK